MNVLMLVLLVLVVLAARTIQLRLRLAAWERLWRFGSGPFTVELRRRAELARLDHDSLEFPQPREFRVLSLRVGGIPVWSQQAIVSLPAEADARIGHIPASEFDPLFDRHFRIAWPRRAARARFLAPQWPRVSQPGATPAAAGHGARTAPRAGADPR